MSATDSLPWNDLKLTQDPVPWDSLRILSDAAAESAEVRNRLHEEMRQHVDRRYSPDPTSFHEFTDLAVPAVFALAADKLDAEGRQESARFLLEMLYLVGEQDDDWMLEVLQDAASRFGAAAAIPALEIVERHGAKAECWFHLCSVLRTAAAQAPDDVRNRIVQVCRKLIATAPDRYERWSTVDAPARVLSRLRDTESLPLLEEIEEKSDSGEIADIITEMKCAAKTSEWEFYDLKLAPVETWLESKLRQAREYLESCDDEADDIDDEDIEAEQKYKKLRNQFAESPAFANLPDPVKPHARFAVMEFLSFAWDYLGIPLEELNGADVEKILTNYFPRKISADDEFYEAAPSALCAFIRWAGETNPAIPVSQLCSTVEECADHMVRNARDPANWGMGKSVSMMALKEGVNLADPSERDAFILRYDQRLEAAHPRTTADSSPAPSRRGVSRIGRNDPCPCGSGRKYKKCCLRNS